MDISDYISLLSFTVSILTLIATLLTLYFAWRIPHQIMVDQRYSDFLNEYRSFEMGNAIHSIFDFFADDCGSKDYLIEEKYVKRYNDDFECFNEPNFNP